MDMNTNSIITPQRAHIDGTTGVSFFLSLKPFSCLRAFALAIPSHWNTLSLDFAPYHHSDFSSNVTSLRVLPRLFYLQLFPELPHSPASLPLYRLQVTCHYRTFRFYSVSVTVVYFLLPTSIPTSCKRARAVFGFCLEPHKNFPPIVSSSTQLVCNGYLLNEYPFVRCFQREEVVKQNG